MEKCDDCKKMERHMHGARPHPALRPVGQPAPAIVGAGEDSKCIERHECTNCGTKWTHIHDQDFAVEGWAVGW